MVLFSYMSKLTVFRWRRTGLFFKRSYKIRLIFKPQPVGDFFDRHGGLFQKAPGLEKYVFVDEFFRRFSRYLNQHFTQVFWGNMQLGGIEAYRFGFDEMTGDERPEFLGK